MALLVLTIFIATNEAEAWPLIFFAIVAFFTLLDGLKKLLSKDRELKFLEISEDTLRFRRFEQGSIDSIKTSSIEVILVAPSFIQVGTRGVSYMIYIEHSASEHELVEIFSQITPNAVVKTTNENDV